MDLKTGDVIQLPVGLRAYHNQGGQLITIDKPAMVVIESTRQILPMAQTGSDAHFEACCVCKARALREDGTYYTEGALLTFAQYGDFRPEFILPAASATVLRRMNKTFVAK